MGEMASILGHNEQRESLFLQKLVLGIPAQAGVVFMTNKALGTRYQQGRFKEWENGKRRPTPFKNGYLQFFT
jgi:hypothetical protein